MSGVLKAFIETTFGSLRLKQIVRKHAFPVVFPVIFIVDRIIIALARRLADAFDENIIFVRTDNLGDFVLWLPAARALRDQWPWPGRRFVLVANASWAGFARNLGVFDQVISVSRTALQRNLCYRVRSILRLGRIKAELLITPIHSRDPTTADTVARAIDARRKVAAAGDSNTADVSLAVSNPWYNELIATPNVSAHASISNKEFMENCLGIEVASPWPALTVRPHEQLPAAIDGMNYVVIAPGAFSQYRIWPPQYFADLADRISSEMLLRTVLIGTASERNETAAVAKACSTPPVDLTAKLDIDKLLCVLKRSKLIVTNETGTAHLGAALRVPTVCIVGGGHFGRFVPYPTEAEHIGIKIAALYHAMPCYHCNWCCIYSVKYADPAPCVARVTAEAAWTAIEGMLG